MNILLPESLHQTSIYVTAMYFIVTTATTVGYGDNRAETMIEMCVLIVFQLFGIMIFSQISG